MIDYVVNRDRLLGAVQQIRDNAPAGGDAEQQAIAALNASVAAQPPLGNATDPESLKTFIPNDAVLSLLQALHEQHMEQDRPDALRTRQTPRGPLASRTVPSFGAAKGFDDPFSNLDVRWISSFVEALAKYLTARRNFRLPASRPRPQELDGDARLILVGDWATGERVADEVAERIRDELADAGGRQTHVVHLGDVYYAGTKWEAEHRFLPHWPVKPIDATRHRSWCLNSNHDMYAAGEGLFEAILEDPRFAQQRTLDGGKTSEFHLRGEPWQILGLDSAWVFDDPFGNAGNFGEQQVDWLADCMSPPNDTGTILLSHHQPFTRKHRGKDGIQPVGNLMAMTESIRRKPGIDAWIWGHEHRLFTYGPRDGIGYPVCSGHGAIPSTPPNEDVAEPGEWEYREVYEDHEGDRWLVSGFTVLDFAGPEITVRYINQFGKLCREPDVIQRA